MSNVKAPLNTAHQHAANADDYRSQGLLIPAAEEHYKAAEAFMACVEQSNDENAKRTLRMLYNEHLKAGKELQRKIAKLREDNQDPTMPQKASPPGTNMHPVAGSIATPYAPHPTPSPPPYARGLARLADSQNNVDESFMVLGQRSDPGDAFNNFWKIMEGMLDNLSQPVAFATAPLGVEANSPRKGLRKDGSSSSDTDNEDSLISRTLRNTGVDLKRNSRQQIGLREETDEEVLADEGDELSESFCLISSGSEPSTSTLKKENEMLKLEVEATQKRLAASEKVLQMRKDQDQQLRDSIVMARHQAQRAMGASVIQQRPGQAVDLSSLNINLPVVPSPMTALNTGRDREAQLLRRIRELEEEVRLVRTDNDKQKAVIARFRDRWEKLKESAKRKKDAKAAAELAKMGARERIEEEPEGDLELDDHTI
ncbi:hypothetical protein SERLADRAFT_473969 [Serpula lacrymans var. lacrymans S7.9]|uniref:MIT domain-containing protein n=1 Tax=Serpula lacrymans var. lacrymans (strain S7.9) TaxID=578457 RepID=F8P4I0_SERL9|nr:uncharacterized protein SERLADRAFT_473969 [Serpula lacrymans var. lacrymans S7.9]EGO21518.1 hypothetical protein SERLADRAFT_473969 [Serpula lacrymans var. lacrymans S7.9]